MRSLTVREIVELHRNLLERYGGAGGIRDVGALQSAVAQPRMTFGGTELYPSSAEKAAALAFSLVTNHPFVDGNKRVAHAALEISSTTAMNSTRPSKMRNARGYPSPLERSPGGDSRRGCANA